MVDFHLTLMVFPANADESRRLKWLLRNHWAIDEIKQTAKNDQFSLGAVDESFFICSNANVLEGDTMKNTLRGNFWQRIPFFIKKIFICYCSVSTGHSNICKYLLFILSYKMQLRRTRNTGLELHMVKIMVRWSMNEVS